MDFPTQYNKRELQPPEFSCPGSSEVVKYSSKADINGHIDVYPDGIEYDMQDYIQSWKDSVDINLLIQRFQRGEETALERIRGVYGDFTKMPQNLAEYYNMLQAGNEFFMTLDPDLRAAFNQNPIEFFTQFGNEDFIKKVEEFDKTHRPIEQTAITHDVLEEEIK